MLTGCYDLARNLPSFDIVSLTLALEQARLRLGEPDLAIEILPGPHEGFRLGGFWPYSVAERRAMLAKVVVPMCAMLPSCRRVTVRYTRAQPQPDLLFYDTFLSTGHFVAAYAAGVRPLRAPGAIVPAPKLVTMTLREAEHWSARNSTLEEWLQAARALSHDCEVIVVRDARFAERKLDGIATAPRASCDLEARARLYASAALNMFVSNGPAWFAFALDVPVLIFRPSTEGANRTASAASMRSLGVVCGAQLAGAPAHQRLVWESETAANIVKCARDFLGL